MAQAAIASNANQLPNTTPETGARPEAPALTTDGVAVGYFVDDVLLELGLEVVDEGFGIEVDAAFGVVVQMVAGLGVEVVCLDDVG